MIMITALVMMKISESIVLLTTNENDFHSRHSNSIVVLSPAATARLPENQILTEKSVRLHLRIIVNISMAAPKLIITVMLITSIKRFHAHSRVEKKQGNRMSGEGISQMANL